MHQLSYERRQRMEPTYQDQDFKEFAEYEERNAINGPIVAIVLVLFFDVLAMLA